MKSKIFLESADPAETKVITELLGKLDGQVVHPGVLSTNAEIKGHLEQKGSFKYEQFMDFYKAIVEQIAQIIPEGVIVATVYTSADTSADMLIDEGKEVGLWTSNVHAQLPASLAGIEAASMLTQAGFRVAVSQVCSQQQAGLVYDITTQALAGDVYITLDVSSLYKKGCDGRSLVEHVQKIYNAGNAHVSVLMSGVTDVETFIWGVAHGVDAVAASGEVLRQWEALHKPTELTKEQSVTLSKKGVPIPYEQIDITQEKNSYTLSNELTEEGITHMVEDWNNLLKK
jgi:transaldolase